MTPREIHSGERVFASDLRKQAHIAMPQPVQPPDEEIELEARIALPQSDEEIDLEARIALPQSVQPPDEEADVELSEANIALPQPVPPPDEGPVVTIYVRKGDHPKERIISINPIPEGADPVGLLNLGFALDGNSATILVDQRTSAWTDDRNRIVVRRWRSEDFFGGTRWRVMEWAMDGPRPHRWSSSDEDWSLTASINAVERALVEWLKSLGCQVKFG